MACAQFLAPSRQPTFATKKKKFQTLDDYRREAREASERRRREKQQAEYEAMFPPRKKRVKKTERKEVAGKNSATDETRIVTDESDKPAEK